MPEDLARTETLGDVLARLEQDESLAQARRRDLASALRRTAELTGTALDAFPAEPVVAVNKLAAINVAGAGLTPKTFQNIRSNTLAALRHTGATDRPALRKIGDSKRGC